MILLWVMLVVYAYCAFGTMRKPALAYLMFTAINLALYPLFDALDPVANANLVTIMYMYGVTEEALKFLTLIVLHTSLKDRSFDASHKPLYLLLCLHVINHAFNNFYYGAVNNVIIVCEMIYFVRGSKNVVAGISSFFEQSRAGSLRRFHFNRRSL